MTIHPIMVSRHGKKVKIQLDQGDEWVTANETRELLGKDGSRLYTKVTKNGEVTRRYYHRASIHHWITEFKAIKYAL
jgi:predicted DNA-binding ArsR family transcriptional regulator